MSETTATAIAREIAGEPIVDVTPPVPASTQHPHTYKTSDGVEHDARRDCGCPVCLNRRHTQADGTVVDTPTGRVVWGPPPPAAPVKPVKPARVKTQDELDIEELEAQLKAKRAKVKATKADAEAQAKAEAEAREKLRAQRQAEADAKNAPILAKLDALAPRLAKAQAAYDALMAENSALQAQLIVLDPPTPVKVKAASNGSGAPRAAAGTGNGAYLTSVPYQFWYRFQKAHKMPAATQKVLSATAKAKGIDLSDLSPENFKRMVDAIA